MERRWKALPEMENCLLMKEKMGVRELKQNEYKVLFESNGKLYVEVEDVVHKIDNPFDYMPQGVEIEMVGGRAYIKGYEPKKKNKKSKK
jgi:hypothetical protein